jgi:hypothetical protein
VDGIAMNDCCNLVVGSTLTGNVLAGVSLGGNFNLVTSSVASGNGGDGIILSTFSNQITSSKSTKNGGFGANVGCSGAIFNLTAKNNTKGSLNTFGGTCTQLNNTL